MTEDVIAHYGVLGMKWGQTRTKGDRADILAARKRVGVQQRRFTAQKRVLRKAKKSGNEARINKHEKKLSDLKVDFLKNPDRVLATRLTKGEKAAALILTLPSTGAVGGLAAIATSSAISRRIEQQQETGAYDKK